MEEPQVGDLSWVNNLDSRKKTNTFSGGLNKLSLTVLQLCKCLQTPPSLNNEEKTNPSVFQFCPALILKLFFSPVLFATKLLIPK